MCFTSQATNTKQCELCFAKSHTEGECAQSGDPDPEVKDRLKAIESVLISLTRKEDSPKPQTRPDHHPSWKPAGSGTAHPPTATHAVSAGETTQLTGAH